MRNAFSVDVEEYFQVEAFADRIPKGDWGNYPSRVEDQTRRLLDILAAHGVRGTFFVLGWVARRHPGLVREIFEAGHEVASHGFEHTMITAMSPENFREDVRQAKQVLEGITGAEVRGYRAPTFSISGKTAWAYEILMDEGYNYSSSVYPIRHDRYGWPEFGDGMRRMGSNGKGDFWEVPMTVGSIGPARIPFGGGGYLRAYPLALTRALFRGLAREGRPAVVYVHPWEIDPRQPVIPSPYLRRLRHRIGLADTVRKLDCLLRSMDFGTVGELVERGKDGSMPHGNRSDDACA